MNQEHQTNKTMSYHISIIRGANDEHDKISIQEFWDACGAMEGFSFNDAGDIAQYSSPQHGTFYVFWKNGDIWVENPDDWVIPVVASLAVKLNGRARGDELESYKVNGDSYIHTDDREDHELWEKRRIGLIKRAKFWSCLRMSILFIVFIIFLCRIFG